MGYVSHVSGRNLKEGLSVFCTGLAAFLYRKKNANHPLLV
jgi:hypothetical protein